MESTSKKVTLSSSDGRTFEVDKAVAFQSQTIKHLYETGCTGDFIPIPNVTGDILSMVIRYCEKHVDSDTAAGKESFYGNKLKRWDALFVKVDQSTLFDLILAADFMNINSLMDLTCKTVANMMKGKTTEEIRGTFNIKNDYTLEAEEMVRRRTNGHSNDSYPHPFKSKFTV